MNLSKNWKKGISDLLKDFRGEVRYYEPMGLHTSFGIGGEAEVLVIPEDMKDLIHILQIVKSENIPHFILGGGTNLLVRDGGIPGAVIKTEGLNKISVKGLILEVEAGVPLPRLLNQAIGKGLAGLEFAAGIPGTLGGAIVMNAGTKEQEMKDVVDSVTILDNGKVREIPKEAIGFEYRSSKIKGIVLKSLIRLEKGNRGTLVERVKEIILHRRKTQPLSHKSAGCIFKNPPGMSAGALIEAIGLKGYSLGAAQVSEVHANFIINKGGATAKDVLSLIDLIREKVKREKGIDLELEVKLVGVD